MTDGEDYSKREHFHINGNPYRFQTVIWAPAKGETQARFAVESMIYVAGMGWDMVNIFTQGNQFLIALRDYIRMKEILGYKHIGKSSDELTTLLSNLWGKDSWDTTHVKQKTAKV